MPLVCIFFTVHTIIELLWHCKVCVILQVVDVDHVRQRAQIMLIPRIDLQALTAKLVSGIRLYASYISIDLLTLLVTCICRCWLKQWYKNEFNLTSVEYCYFSPMWPLRRIESVRGYMHVWTFYILCTFLLMFICFNDHSEGSPQFHTKLNNITLKVPGWVVSLCACSETCCKFVYLIFSGGTGWCKKAT